MGLFVPPGAAFVVGGDEAFDRTVVGQFHIFREEAGRQLAFGAVMGNALAAVSVADTPRGAARTLRVSGTLLTFHRLILFVGQSTFKGDLSVLFFQGFKKFFLKLSIFISDIGSTVWSVK